METNDKCILLKRKEYDELVKKAESKKPDYIQIRSYYHCGRYGYDIESNIDLSENLSSQILRIYKNIVKDLNNKYNVAFEHGVNEGEKDLKRDLRHMSWLERRRYLNN